MPCFYPLRAWKTRAIVDGQHSVTFNRKSGLEDAQVKLPCGRCIGCRLDRSREWALRCIHEARQHDENSFVTLTYAEEPENGTLVPEDFTRFIRRLRRKHGKVRYFMCGEYGKDATQPTGLGRPHYHAIIFGYMPKDRIQMGERRGYPFYGSKELTELWTHGHTELGTVTQQSAGYVARYVTKKKGGEQAIEHYRKINFHTGELVSVLPEFQRCSNRPGIGACHAEKYLDDLNKGFVTNNGVKNAIPRYYKKIYKRKRPDDFPTLSRVIEERIDQDDPNTEFERLVVREKAQNLKLKRLGRD